MRLPLVKDDAMMGKTLPQSVLDHFFHLNDGLNDIDSGRGLAIVKTIADRHGITLQLSQSERLIDLRAALKRPLSKPSDPAVL